MRWSGRRHCSEGSKRLIHVSNFRPVKRAPEAIEIFSRVKKEYPCELLMVGDGPDLGTAVALARQLGIADCVQFLGNREDVSLLMSASDIMLLPSGSESFGLAALEAMASGCAVVCTDVGGLPEVIMSGVSGFLREPTDHAGMAADAIALLTDSALHRRVTEAALSRVREEFCVERVVPMYERYYEHVLGR